MNQALWIAKTGLDAQQTKMSNIANNLAKCRHHGLQAQPGDFCRHAFYQNVRQVGRSPRRIPCCRRA